MILTEPRAGDEVLQLRLHSATRELIEEIKRDSGLMSDTAVICQALALQHRVGRHMMRGGRLFIGAGPDAIEAELVLPPNQAVAL